MNTKRTLSSQALAAKQIKAKLKTAFPSITFRIKSESFSGGTSVDIFWKNGPTYEKVDAIVKAHEYGKFDSMQDIYEYSNVRPDIAQVKYVMTHREIEDNIIQHFFEKFKNMLSGWENLSNFSESSEELYASWNVWNPREYIMRHLRDLDLTDFSEITN